MIYVICVLASANDFTGRQSPGQGSTVVREDTVLPSTSQFFSSGGGHGIRNEEERDWWLWNCESLSTAVYVSAEPSSEAPTKCSDAEPTMI